MTRIVACMLFLGMVLAVPASAGDTPWFDFQNCSMCKPIMAQEGLMDHSTFEALDLSDGMMTLVTVDPSYEAKFMKAAEGMSAVQKKLEAGEKLPLCGQCMDTMEIIGAGATVDQVMTQHGMAMVMTSSDPKLVAHMHEHVAKTKAEMHKMMGGGDHGSDDGGW